MKSILNLLKVVLLFCLVVIVASCGGAEERKVKYLEKGKAYLEDNNLKKARIEFKNVLQIDPKYAEAYFYMGRLQEKNKELRSALGYYQKAIELDPKYLDPKLKLARIYVIAGTQMYMDKAIALIDDVFAEDENNIEAQLIKATISYKTGNKRKAIEDMEKIVRQDFSLVEGVRLLSAIYDNSGEKGKAIKLLEKALANNNENIPLRMSLARLYTSVDKKDDAEKVLLKIINIDPEKYVYRIALATFYTAIKKNDKAEKVLRDAIRDNNDEDEDEGIKRYLSLIEFISRNKSVKDAENELLVMVGEKPDVYEFKFALSMLYSKIGDVKKAKNVLKNIIKDRSYDVEGVKARTLLAEFLLSEKNISGVKKLINEVFKEYPDNNDALFINGKVALVNNDPETAINSLRTVLKNQPNNVDAAKLLSIAHETLKESALAEDVLKKSIESNPLDYKTHLNYAMYLGTKKRLDESLDVLDKAILYFKDNFELLDLKLKIAAARKDESEIVKILATMKSDVSDKAEVFVTQGQFYISKKKYSEAISEFEQALIKTNDKYKVLSLIINTYLIQNNPGQAIQRINQRLEKYNNDPISYQLLGKIYGVQKDYLKAVTNFRKAIGLMNSWMEPYQGLISVYMAERNIQKAINIYKEAIANTTNTSILRVRLASLYEKEKEFDKAMREYDLILTTDPDNKAVRNNLATLLVDNRSDAKSIARAKKLTEGFDGEKHPALKDTLGWVYVKSGENEKARKILTEIVENSPDIAVFKYHLGVALNNSGEKTLAKKYILESVKSKQEFTGKDHARKLLKKL